MDAPPASAEAARQGHADRVRVWRHPSCAGLELKRGVAGPEPVAPHLHDAYQLTLVVDGTSVFRYRRAEHAVPAGSLMVVHPGEVHANRSTGARAFRSAYVDGSLVAELVGCGRRGGGDGRAPPFVPAPVVRCPEAVGAFGACLDAADAAVAASPLEIESRLSGALRLLLLAAGVHAPSLPACPDRREHRAVARAKEMLRAGHDGDLSLRALAAATGLHPNYLLNVFTREVGVSPHRYLGGVRVEQAKALLRRGQPVAEVALATGFSDQSHLTRAFKRHTLLTPGRYRAGEAAGSGDL